MAEIDASINEPNETSAMADRADCYRVALRLLADAGLASAATPVDVLDLAQFLSSGVA